MHVVVKLICTGANLCLPVWMRKTLTRAQVHCLNWLIHFKVHGNLLITVYWRRSAGFESVFFSKLYYFEIMHAVYVNKLNLFTV